MRSRRGSVVVRGLGVGLALGLGLGTALGGCGGGSSEDPVPATGSSSASSASTSTSSTATTATTSTTGGASPSSSARSDPPQPADARDAGLADVDTGAEAMTLDVPALDLTAQLSPQALRDGRLAPGPGRVVRATGEGRVAPGAEGTALLAGRARSGGAADVFADLAALRPGDGVVLTYPSGTQLRLEVTRTAVVDRTALASDDALRARPAAGTRRIVLVTSDDRIHLDHGPRDAALLVVAEVPS
ncbi:class F sortase [Janibacter sp. G349]|uniref:class F sortase n=1 Tax=Janibacter sp. G349 TaxID=3405424 RepID=UPI003B802DD0